MSYLSSLRWQGEMDGYNEAERKILMALSREKYRWRTRDRLAKATGLTVEEADKLLSRLIKRRVVRPSMSRKKEVIFGLTERVGM